MHEYDAVAEMQELQKTINLASAQIAAVIARLTGSLSKAPEPEKWVDKTGHLTTDGISELKRRIHAGQGNRTIAEAMKISTAAVAARRRIWGGQQPSPPNDQPSDSLQKYRQFRNGRLNEDGENEVRRLLENGESDNSIALALGISIPSAYKRRKIWQRSEAK